jgi:preprotein translocase subunit Sec63
MRRCAQLIGVQRRQLVVPLVAQKRWQYMQAPGKRDQDAFLSQFDPLDVLCLDESCSVKDIHEAHKRLTAKYGPTGPSPDTKAVEKVRRAHEVLTDPTSSYYARAHTSDTDRQRLQFEMLPKGQRKVFQFHIVGCVILIGIVACITLTMAMQPYKRVQRAALR